MNKVILIGRLTRDPELRHTQSGTAVCSITVAIDRPPDLNGQRQADFIGVTVWNKQAENVARYMTKGRLIAVEGRIQTRNYENSDGRKVYVTEVVASNVQFLESKSAVNNNSNSDYSNSYSGNTVSDAMPFDFGAGTTQGTFERFTPLGNNEASNGTVDVEKDPFESFGQSVAVSDNDLPF